jgi:hypothetical protein
VIVATKVSTTRSVGHKDAKNVIKRLSIDTQQTPPHPDCRGLYGRDRESARRSPSPSLKI